jgi:hypothetical protein
MSTGLAQRRRWALLFFSAFLGLMLALFAGCGRSALDDALFFEGGVPEGGVDVRADGDAQTPDAGKCSPLTCPSGCCDAKGVCRAGTDLQACGSFGRSCSDCAATGFDFCDQRAHACGKTVQDCNAKTCPTGCCERGECLAGADPDECGTAAQACQHCASQGLSCDPTSRKCGGNKCGPGTCPGCCIGDLCVGGTDPNACGRAGQQCQNCAAQGTVCQPTSPGGICEGQPTCGPQNCPGCCIGNICVAGIDDSACGLAGQQCQNCSNGGLSCQPAGSGGGFCGKPTCGPANCKGCCQGNTCRGGGDAFACGVGGQQCQQCPLGQSCQGGRCVGMELCGLQNCPFGCCIGDICAAGTQDTACGVGGQICQNCAAQGAVCAGGKCSQTCGPQNCNGCCAGNVCVGGTSASQCGAGGQACKDCSAIGEVCQNGICSPPPPPCSPTTCPGCCDPALGCVAGFLNTRCGSGGAACVNCTAQKSTCDTAVLPRVCKNQQTTCPAPYGSCPASVTTSPLPIQHVCSATDLQDARAACAGGPNTPACVSYFQFEQQFNPACAACLKPFDVPFLDASGIFECVAPYVGPLCDHATGCAIDCQKVSCQQCPPASFTQCRNDVRQTQCAIYFQQSQCIGQALFGAGAFCNPGNYQGNFGAWLQGVGGHYCGP